MHNAAEVTPPKSSLCCHLKAERLINILGKVEPHDVTPPPPSCSSVTGCNHSELAPRPEPPSRRISRASLTDPVSSQAHTLQHNQPLATVPEALCTTGCVLKEMHTDWLRQAHLTEDPRLPSFLYHCYNCVCVGRVPVWCLHQQGMCRCRKVSTLTAYLDLQDHWSLLNVWSLDSDQVVLVNICCLDPALLCSDIPLSWLLDLLEQKSRLLS